MDFNDPALEHLVNKITIALHENNREEAARYMDIIIEEYPEVANILMRTSSNLETPWKLMSRRSLTT